MKTILKDYKAGKISLDEVLQKIKSLPYKDLDFAKIDTHCIVRKGFPETIFCQGKTIPQIIKIIGTMTKNNHDILATKANKQIFSAIKKEHPHAEYNDIAKTIIIQKKEDNIRITNRFKIDPLALEAYCLFLYFRMDLLFIKSSHFNFYEFNISI